jgi:hypothetical protein
MYIGLHAKYPLICQVLLKLQFSRHIYEKYSNIEFYENMSSGGRVVACGRTDRLTDMTKLIVGYRSFTKAPKNSLVHTVYLCVLYDT